MHKKQIYKLGITNKLDKFKFGNYALIAISNGTVTGDQLNAARIAIKRKIRGFGSLWVRVRPNKILTKKSSGIRMGKGKGSVDKLIYAVQKDEIIMELQLGRFSSFARRLLFLGASKLGVRTNIKFRY